MIHAALDTSVTCCFVLADDERILFKGTLASASRDNDRKLPPWILSAVENAGLTLADVKRWTVGIGPGSFAGLRSGIAFVLGICSATGAQVRGVPSAIASAAAVLKGDPSARVGVIMDGRCGEVIHVPVRNGKLDDVPSAMVPADLLAEENRCDLWVTPQAELLPELPETVQKALVSITELDPEVLLRSTAVEWNDNRLEALKSCEPIYVRPPVFVKPIEPKSIAER